MHRIAGLVVALALVVVAAPAQAAPVPDASTGHRVDPGRTGFLGGGTLSRPPLRERWRKTLGTGVSYPVVVGSRIYTTFRAPSASGSTIAALDVTDGDVIWERAMPGATKVAYGDGGLAILNDNGTLTVVEADTGATRWTSQLREPFDFYTSPVVDDGLVYVGLAWSGGAGYALRMSDGSTAWTESFYYAGGLSVAGGLAFQSDGCTTLAADARTGERAWSSSHGCTSYDGSVASDGGHVVVNGYTFGSGGKILDGSNGRLLDAAPLTGEAAIAGDTVVHRDGSILRARSLKTGLTLWSTAPEEGVVSTSPVVVDHVAYVGSSDGRVLAFDLGTGDPLWDAQTGTSGQVPGEVGIGAGSGVLAVPVAGSLVVYEPILPGPAPGAGLRVLTGPWGPGNDAVATFTFTAPGPPTECRMDAGSWTPCAAAESYPALPEGSHSFQVRTRNLDGTLGSLAARGFSIDRTAPVSEITGSAGTTSSQYLTFYVRAPGASRTECRLDDAAWATCRNDGSSISFGNLADGEHVFQARSRDAAGNLEEPPAERRVVVDATGPDVTVDERPPSLTNRRTAKVAWHTSEAVASTTCRWDYGATAACSSPAERGELADGHHTLTVEVVDRAGNRGYASVGWTVDTNPPETQLHATPPVTMTEGETAEVGFSSPDYGATFECSLEAGPWSACTSPWRSGPQDPGTYTFEVRGVDAAGNADATPSRASWTVQPAGEPQPGTEEPGEEPVASPTPSPVFTPSDDAPAPAPGYGTRSQPPPITPVPDGYRAARLPKPYALPSSPEQLATGVAEWFEGRSRRALSRTRKVAFPYLGFRAGVVELRLKVRLRGHRYVLAIGADEVGPWDLGWTAIDLTRVARRRLMRARRITAEGVFGPVAGRPERSRRSARLR